MGRKPARWWGRVSLHFAARTSGLRRRKCDRGLGAADAGSRLRLGEVLATSGPAATHWRLPASRNGAPRTDKAGGRRQTAYLYPPQAMLPAVRCPVVAARDTVLRGSGSIRLDLPDGPRRR